MATYTDQMNREVVLPAPPKRIISLVPSQTELLYWLGLDRKVVGVTKFCIHPYKAYQNKNKIGGTKKLNLKLIRELRPDLIIGNKEENDQSQIEELMEEFPVWMSDIESLDDALDMISRVGELTGTSAKALDLVQQIQEGFGALGRVDGVRVAYFIWRNPYMVAGDGTFINDLLNRCGFQNVFGGLNRYPQIHDNQLLVVNPEVILLSSEPYPFKDQHIEELQVICPDAKIMLVDGEMFSWYGSRLLYVPKYLENLMTSVIS